MEQENKLSRNYLNALPGRDDIAARLKKIWNFERWSPPEHFGRYWFYSHNDGLQNQSVIYAAPDPDEKARLRLVSKFDFDTTQPEWALGYRFDIVLRGRQSTPFEGRP